MAAPLPFPQAAPSRAGDGDGQTQPPLSHPAGDRTGPGRAAPQRGRPRRGRESTPGRPAGLSPPYPGGKPRMRGRVVRGEEAGGHQIQIAAEEGGEKTRGKEAAGGSGAEEGGKEGGGEEESGRGVWKTLRERGRGRERSHGGRRGRQRCQGKDRAASGTHGRSSGQPPRPARRAPPALLPSLSLSLPPAGTMVDRGPLLTSAIIFYLSIGAAIFEVLEEPHWRSATDDYKRQKTELLKQFPCLGQEGLDKILQVQRAPPGRGLGRGRGWGRGRGRGVAAAGAAGRPGAENTAPLGGRAVGLKE